MTDMNMIGEEHDFYFNSLIFLRVLLLDVTIILLNISLYLFNIKGFALSNTTFHMLDMYSSSLCLQIRILCFFMIPTSSIVSIRRLMNIMYDVKAGGFLATASYKTIFQI